MIQLKLDRDWKTNARSRMPLGEYQGGGIVFMPLWKIRQIEKLIADIASGAIQGTITYNS